MFSEKNSRSEERTVSGKRGMVKRGVAQVGRRKVLMISTAKKGQASSRKSSTQSPASLHVTFFRPSSTAQQSSRKRGVVYPAMP